MAARWLGNTPLIAEKHYLITSDEDIDEAAGMDNHVPGKKSSAVDVQSVISGAEAVQHQPATDRIKQNPAGTYASSCGVTRVDSDSQSGEGGIRTPGTLRYVGFQDRRIRVYLG